MFWGEGSCFDCWKVRGDLPPHLPLPFWVGGLCISCLSFGFSPPWGTYLDCRERLVSLHFQSSVLYSLLWFSDL